MQSGPILSPFMEFLFERKSLLKENLVQAERVVPDLQVQTAHVLRVKLWDKILLFQSVFFKPNWSKNDTTNNNMLIAVQGQVILSHSVGQSVGGLLVFVGSQLFTNFSIET